MKKVISSICAVTLMATLLMGCGEVIAPAVPPTQAEPTQDQVTSATGVVKGARYTMQVQVGHAYSQRPIAGTHNLDSASPLTNQPEESN